MSGQVLFKFRNARGEPESVIFDGIHITAVELKNLIAEKKGLTDSALELSDPKTKSVFDDNHVFPRGSAVTVRRVAASKTQTRAQQAAAAADATESIAAGPATAALQSLSAFRGATAASADPGDENAQLEQRKVNQGKEDAEIGLIVSAQDEAWRAQSDKNILAARAREQQLAAQRGRGRGFGSHMHGRGRGPGGQPTGFCKFCGKMNDHYSDDCPYKHNPRTDLRHVRTPAGIPAELLEQSSEGGLLLASGKTGALKASTDLASQAFAALPTAAKRAPALQALANAPHEQQDEQSQLLLANGDQQQKQQDEEADAEAAGLDKLGQDDEPQELAAAAAVSGTATAAEAPTDAAPPAADIDTDDAYLFDDDFGLNNPQSDGVSGGLLDDDDEQDLAADGAAVQLNLGLGMQLPEPQQPTGGSQPPRSPLQQLDQEPGSPKQMQQQQQRQPPAGDKQGPQHEQPGKRLAC